MAIDQKTADLLRQLQTALCDCLASNDMEQTITALEDSGYRVFVYVDAVQDEPPVEEDSASDEEWELQPARFTRDDELFLKAMCIGVDSGAKPARTKFEKD